MKLTQIVKIGLLIYTMSSFLNIPVFAQDYWTISVSLTPTSPYTVKWEGKKNQRYRSKTTNCESDDLEDEKIWVTVYNPSSGHLDSYMFIYSSSQLGASKESIPNYYNSDNLAKHVVLSLNRGASSYTDAPEAWFIERYMKVFQRDFKIECTLNPN